MTKERKTPIKNNSKTNLPTTSVSEQSLIVTEKGALSGIEEFPAFKAAEDLSGEYQSDLWNLGRIIARRRGPTIQRTAEDIAEADRKLRSGWGKRKTWRKGVGIGCTAVGLFVASQMIECIKSPNDNRAFGPIGNCVVFVGAIIVALIGVLLQVTD